MTAATAPIIAIIFPEPEFPFAGFTALGSKLFLAVPALPAPARFTPGAGFVLSVLLVWLVLFVLLVLFRLENRSSGRTWRLHRADCRSCGSISFFLPCLSSFFWGIYYYFIVNSFG